MLIIDKYNSNLVYILFSSTPILKRLNNLFYLIHPLKKSFFLNTHWI
jgi:hypothetical protein